MSNQKDIIVIEQREVEFYGDDLVAVRTRDQHIYVAIGQMCDALGLDRASQVRRIRNDEVLAEGYQGSVKLTYPDGGIQASSVLRVDMVPLWLTGIRLKAVRDEIRPKLERFKKEAAKVLWEAFQQGRLTAEPAFEELLQQETPAVQAYRVAMAIVDMARQQIIMESQLDDFGKRLEAVEAQLSDPNRFVTEAEAMEISQAVKNIAYAEAQSTGQANYGKVYGQLYRHFGITGYKKLPAVRFQEAMDFLREWYVQVSDGADVPF